MSRPILELRNAERAAEQTVEVAKRERSEKLRQAREQARDDIQKLRNNMTDELRRYEGEHAGEVDVLTAQMANENKQKEREIEAAVAAHSAGIVEMLLQRVVDVRVDNIRYQ